MMTHDLLPLRFMLPDFELPSSVCTAGHGLLAFILAAQQTLPWSAVLCHISHWTVPNPSIIAVATTA